MTPAQVRDAADRLRAVKHARAQGATWAQVAPLLGCTGARAAKAKAHALERALHPVAVAMALR